MSSTLYAAEAGVATITLDAPERRNAFGRDMMASLMANFQLALADPSVRVIVLTNTGTTFSAGADLKEGRPTDLAPGRLPFHDILDAIDESPKPVVGRIAGHAAGGAAALVALCDAAVMVDSARIGVTEVRLGLPPADVAAYLAHRFPYRVLVEAFLTGEMLPARRAAELGLCNAAVPPEELDATVQWYVEAFVKSAPQAVATTKRWLQTMVQLTPDQAKALAREAMSNSLFDAAEGAEGVAAFLEKRLPSWIPR